MNIIKFNSFVRRTYVVQTGSVVNYFNRKHQRDVSTGRKHLSKLATDQKPDWYRAVSEAEKIVGYPTSFFNLRWLLSDEVANVALHLRKLVGSSHPFLKTAKSLFYSGKNSMQTWGLIVLLISKAAGHSSTVPDLEQDKAAGVLHTQRALAEITEMIRTSNIIHKSLLNVYSNPNAKPAVDNDSDILFGNKISLLSGDYLLSTSCVELANLKNQEVIELIAAALRDQTEAEFVGVRDRQNIPLPGKPKGPTSPSSSEASAASLTDLKRETEVEGGSIEPLPDSEVLGDARAEWTLRNVLSAGNLLGRSCQCAMKLAGRPPQLQRQGYLFGKNLALAWQACIDREPFQEGQPPANFSLVSAPVMFQLEHDPSLYAEIEKGLESVNNVDFDRIYRAVLDGPGLEKTALLLQDHSQTALEVLQQFPKSDATTALTNIIVAMQDL